PGFGGPGNDAAEAANLEAHYRAEARRFFRPELFNRLDDIVVFRPLGARELRSIVDRELDQVAAREGLRRRDITLEIDGAARQHLEVVERAAAVRADVRRWSRSDAMVQLQQKLAFFDRASRQPRFWDDRALADESARTAAEARELEKAFLAAEQQAEAAEDLA